MDFDKLEHLLQTNDFEFLNADEKEFVLAHLSELEYTAMRELYLNTKTGAGVTITPRGDIKSRLDSALKTRQKSTTGIHFHMPLYQVAAVALIFLLLGIGINYQQKTPTKVIARKTIQVRYITKQIEKVRYIAIYPTSKPDKSVNTKNETSNPSFVEDYSVDSNPEAIRQQEIVMANIEHVLNEKNGISIGSDTVLQKMLVTVN